MRMRRAHERGFALLIVLWTLALVALLVSHVLADSRTELKLTANLQTNAVAEEVADGAVYQATFRLMAGQWAADGVGRQLPIGAGIVELRIVDLAGRINPNLVSPQVMRQLLVEVGAPPAQADRVAAAMEDWRTEGDEPQPLGAKAPQYLAAHRGYVPTGQPFRNLQEIGLVLGMTPALLAALTPHLSVFAPGTSEPLFADPLVARALGAEDGTPAPAADQGEPQGPEVVEITAAAFGPAGARFTRHAVIRFAPPSRGNPNPWRILSWE
jgi:general secretion pathway protein K